jgi:hypothetical protein
MRYCLRIETMPLQLSGHREAVGRECPRLNQDTASLASGPVEAREHQVQIDGQRVHYDDFVFPATDKARKLGTQRFVVGNPGSPGGLVADCSEPLPVVELLADLLAGSQGHQPERMAAKIDEGFAPLVAREAEARAKAS